MDNNESFRNELLAKITDILPREKVSDVLSAVDQTLANYDLKKKPMDIIPAGGIPEVVKMFIATRAIGNRSMKTLNQYKYKLLNFFNAVKKPFQSVNANDLRMYLYNYKTSRHVSDRTLENTRIIINSFFKWLADNDYLPKNPVATVERILFQEKIRNPLTAYELEEIRYDCEDIREKALIDFLYSTGCRIGECCDANISNIDWNKRSLLIEHGKGNKQRIVFFNAESELSLKKYLATREDGNDALFVSQRKPHQRLTIGGIQNIISKVEKRSNIEVYAHKLRHTFATTGLQSGLSLEQVQKLMGHVSPKTTLIYAKLDMNDIQRQHARTFI